MERRVISENKKNIKSLQIDVEKLLKQNAERIQILSRLIHMSDSTVKELADYSLEAAVRLTESQYGYLAFLNEDETTLQMYSWSGNALEDCRIENIILDYEITKTGLWGEAVRQRKPIITNDYKSSFTGKKGYPAGHVELTRHMNIPVLSSNKIVALAGVANKTDEYNDTDVLSLELLMDSMMRLIERRRTEDSLKESENRFRLVLESMPIGLWLADKDGNLVLGNKAGQNIWGAHPLIGQDEYNIFEAWRLPGRIKIKADDWALGHAVNNGKVTEAELLEIKDFNGLTKYILNWASPIKNLKEEIIGAFVINQDITDRFLNEEKIKKYQHDLEALIEDATKDLKNSEERFRALAENAADYILRFDLNGTILYANPATHEGLNVLQNNILGGRIKDLDIPENMAQEIESVIVEVIETRKKHKKEYLLKNNTWTEWLYIPEIGSDEKVKSIIVTGRDITEKIKYQIEIRKALDHSQEMNELKSRFVSLISHEFRTPLSTILSSSELIQLFGDRLNESEKSVHFKKISNSVDYLTSMLNDVLTINHSDSGKLHIDYSEVEFVSFTKEIIADLKNSFSAVPKIWFSSDTEVLLFRCDKKILRHIVANLISNAIKYTNLDKDIFINVKQENDFIVFSVTDKGIGIPHDFYKDVYSPFSRAMNMQNVPGSGLGLSIVKRSVDILNGKIEFNSKENEGTNFIVSLPTMESTN